MEQFDGLWTEERIRDLVMAHKGRSHVETADILTKHWGKIVTGESVRKKWKRLSATGPSLKPKIEAKEEIEPPRNRDFFSRVQNDENLSKPRTYFVTSAIAGGALASSFFKAVEKFCEKNYAKLVVLPMRGVTSKKEEYSKDVLEEISEYFYTEYVFNKSLEAFDLCLNPNTANPLVGTARIAQKRSCLIVASPKQNMETTPVANYDIPHVIYSTGAITEPYYDKTRSGKVATEDHIIGGLIVEVASNKIFHIRQVQADRTGSFYDLNWRYTPLGATESTAEGWVPGDIHNGFQDPSAMKAWDEVIKLTKPKNIIFHDIFDSRSISHHEEHNLSVKSTRPDKFKFLETELRALGTFIIEQKKKAPWAKFYSVASNHNEHLDRYLDEARFIYDHHNYRLALELAIDRVDGKNVLEEAMKRRFKGFASITWLKRDDSLVIAGVEVGAHGDLGANGSRGSLVGLEKAYTKSVTGHSHTPRIFRSAFQVGTSTSLKIGYNQGPSSWLHAGCLIHKGGQRQLIIAINGEWRNG